MTQDEPKKRTKQFALRIINLVESFPNTYLGRHVGGQLTRSGTSVSSNYRAADESAFWMEFGLDANLVKADRVSSLQDEANQLIAIFVSSINTARGRRR